MSGRLRVGAVSYLNARPLYEGLAGRAPGIELCLDVPSGLADRMRAGDLDIALVPSVEYLRGRELGWEILPGFAIAAKGAVRSVRLFSRVPWGQVGRLALDEGSRTSQVLAQVWLNEVHGVRPKRIEPHPLGVPIQESLADAVLLIGDRAMRVPMEGFVEVADLGAAWHALTGFPFVFAVWAVRPGLDLGELPGHLAACRAESLANVDRIYENHGRRLGLTSEECRDYLTRILSYGLGEDEAHGLRQFAGKAAALGLAPPGGDLVFHRRRDLAARR